MTTKCSDSNTIRFQTVVRALPQIALHSGQAAASSPDVANEPVVVTVLNSFFHCRPAGQTGRQLATARHPQLATRNSMEYNASARSFGNLPPNPVVATSERLNTASRCWFMASLISPSLWHFCRNSVRTPEQCRHALCFPAPISPRPRSRPGWGPVEPGWGPVAPGWPGPVGSPG